jgi:hypothetical protein
MTTKEKQKKQTHDLHQKFYSKKAPVAVAPLPKQETRQAMMLEAKARGIKNFRILNKAELGFVLCEGQSKENILVCVGSAVARWKAGWGKKKNAEVANA